jgi:hypothetical protein
MACRVRLWALVVLLGAVAPTTARAAPADDSVERRYAFIQAELARDDPYARQWWTVWTVLYSASVVGGGVVAAVSSSHETRVSTGVLAAKSVVGVGSLALTYRGLFAREPELNDSTPEPPAMRLARAESILERRARAETAWTGWRAQVGSLAVNLGAGAVLWFGYGLHRAAIIDVASGVAVSEVEILTAPNPAIDSLRRYRAGELAPPTQQRLSWSVFPIPGGGGLRLSF